MRNVRTAEAVLGIDDDISQAVDRVVRAFDAFSGESERLRSWGIPVDGHDPVRSIEAAEAVMNVPTFFSQDSDIAETADLIRRLIA